MKDEVGYIRHTMGYERQELGYVRHSWRCPKHEVILSPHKKLQEKVTSSSGIYGDKLGSAKKCWDNTNLKYPILSDLSQLVSDLSQLVSDLSQLVADLSQLVSDLSQLVSDLSQLA